MKARCYCKTNEAYNNYGNRGIVVCTEWLEDFGTFKAWSEANFFEEGLHIHRIENDGPYAPDNCMYLPGSEHIRLHNLTTKEY